MRSWLFSTLTVPPLLFSLPPFTLSSNVYLSSLILIKEMLELKRLLERGDIQVCCGKYSLSQISKYVCLILTLSPKICMNSSLWSWLLIVTDRMTAARVCSFSHPLSHQMNMQKSFERVEWPQLGSVVCPTFFVSSNKYLKSSLLWFLKEWNDSSSDM